MWEIDNKEGFKNVGQAFNKLAKTSVVFPHSIIMTSGEQKVLVTRTTFYVPVS